MTGTARPPAARPRAGPILAPFAALLAATIPTLAAGAQVVGGGGRGSTVQLRADLLAARATTVHAGAAVLWPVGRSVSVGLQGGAGVTEVDAPPDAGATVASGRAELVARFELDPYQERRWGLYGSAGGGVLAVRGETGRPLVFATVGIERRARSRLVPAFELGLGGGVRVGMVVRRR